MKKAFCKAYLGAALFLLASTVDAGPRSWMKTAKGWLKSFRQVEVRALELAEFRKGLEDRCKVADADKERMDALKKESADAIAEARRAWHDWRQGLGVEPSVQAKVKIAELAHAELQKMLDQAKESDAACRK